MVRGNPKVTDVEVRDFMSRVLFSSSADLADLIEAVNREHNIRLESHISLELRRSAGSTEG